MLLISRLQATIINDINHLFLILGDDSFPDIKPSTSSMPTGRLKHVMVPRNMFPHI